MLLATAVLAAAGLIAVAKRAASGHHKAVDLLTELAAGAGFAFGLVYTGMVRPTKVSSQGAAWRG